MKEDLHIERCVNPRIQDKYDPTLKNFPVYYDGMLLPLKKVCRVKINDILSEIGTVGKY